MISVLVLTKNEEQDLPACLESLSWSDDVIVLDSRSTDRTVEIARAAGARVVERTFDNWACHQNWALQNIEFRHSWVYYSDADERVTALQAEEMLRAVEEPMGHVAFRMPRRDYFMGRWLRYCIPSPFNIRLFRPEKMRYERLINPVPVPSGTVGELKNHFDHFPFSKGMTHWLAKHNAYSSLEAEQIVRDRVSGVRASLGDAIFCKDINERRRHQKNIFYRVPMRPWVKFVVFYFIRRGFLDGRAGFTYATLQSIYEYMIVLKTRELLESAAVVDGLRSRGGPNH